MNRSQNTEVIAPLLAQLGDRNEKTAQRAQDALSNRGISAVAGLVAACQSPSPEVQFRAVWALGEIRDERGFPALVRATQDPDGRVAYDALTALGKWGGLEVLPVLLHHLQQESTEDSLPSAAASGLMRMGDLALPHLHYAVQNASPKTREQIEFLIERISEESASNEKT